MNIGLLDGTERFFLARVQISNWGTFSGYHDIRVAEKGHLFVGGSGSGKSTILDAMSVLLTPRTINFNAAARQGEKRSDRSFMSYIRGAWSSEADGDGKAASKFLRTKATWSGIALTYKSDLQRTVTLLFIGVIKGGSREEAAVRKNYFIVRGEFELMDLKDFGPQGFDVRLVKARYPNSKHYSSFAQYSDDFCKYFGIEDEKVLELLHKAQSAKNMGDINYFFREFMLEVPKTYDMAALLADSFTRLNAAYELVKDARRQVAVLTEAQQKDAERLKACAAVEESDRLNEALPAWKAAKTLEFLSRLLPQMRQSAAQSKTLFDVSKAEKDELEKKLNNLRIDQFRSGGERLIRLQQDEEQTENKLGEAKRRRDKLLEPLQTLKLSAPRTFADFESLKASLLSEGERLHEELAAVRDKRDALGYEIHRKEEFLSGLTRDIAVMKKHPSNIPAKYLELRDDLASELGLDLTSLPFAGELLQIKEEEAVWQGALERVLHSFSTSLLVSEANYPALARAVDKRHLGLKLVYLRVPSKVKCDIEPDEDSLPLKFDVKPGSWRTFVYAELVNRFNYRCVESTSEFSAFEKAVTRAGQVKHNRIRHEKDDRRAVSDRTAWCTGFDNREKLRRFESDAAELKEAVRADSETRSGLDAEWNAAQKKLAAVARVAEAEWTDFDTASLELKLSEIKKSIDEVKKNSDLQLLSRRIAECEAEKKEAEARMQRLYADQQRKEREVEEKTELETRVKDELGKITADISTLSRLSELDGEIQSSELALSNIGQHVAGMERCLARINKEESLKAQNAETKLTERLAFYSAEWPAKAADFLPKTEYAEEFFRILNELVADGLPNFEKDFRDLLENHAKQNLIDLYKDIETEKRNIKARMKEVNLSLSEAVFNRAGEIETHLIIDIKDRHLAEFEEFKKEQLYLVKSDPSDMSLTEAEDYFVRLKDLVEKLDPKRVETKIWRDRVLDVREHVTFQGREINGNNETLDIYDSGAGKSGGQRQKLTMTCLVAALRYQLGGSRDRMPSFAPIVMDEAFDKADSEFTDISMQIFKNFGFQPIIATPEKGLYTLEPYMGSFSYVSCQDRMRSSVVNMTLHQIEQLVGGSSGENAGHS
jgi:uncharacterized protein YPO0396